MNSKLVLVAISTLLGLQVACLGQNATSNAPVVAEVTIKDDGKIARVSVYLISRSKEEQTLFSGRVGTSGSGRFDPVDLDRIAKDTNGFPFGNGALIVPELTFGPIKFSAPTTVHWGATFRNMLPTLIKLEENERLFYCVFSVPSFYVQREFVSGRLQFPMLPKGKEKPPLLEVPVTKCTREKYIQEPEPLKLR